MASLLPDIWTIAALVLALIGVGASVISVPGSSHPEFWIARICFAAAAALFFAKLGMWGAEDLTVVRLVLVGLLGAIIAVALAFGLYWVNSKQAAILPLSTHSSLDNTVQLSCEWSQLPTVAPANPVFELQLNNHFIAEGGVQSPGGVR